MLLERPRILFLVFGESLNVLAEDDVNVLVTCTALLRSQLLSGQVISVNTSQSILDLLLVWLMVSELSHYILIKYGGLGTT